MKVTLNKNIAKINHKIRHIIKHFNKTTEDGKMIKIIKIYLSVNKEIVKGMILMIKVNNIVKKKDHQ